MSRFTTPATLAAAMITLAGAAHAQFNPTGTTTLSVNVAAEAAIQVTSSSTTLATTGANFSSDFTGGTSFTYKIRSQKSGGTGTVTLKVTSDFNTGGPSVSSPPTAEDALKYTCTVTSPATGCSGSQTAQTTGSTPVATFGPDAKSSKPGNTGSLSWTLSNDPAYSTGTYTATVTLTISAA